MLALEMLSRKTLAISFPRRKIMTKLESQFQNAYRYYQQTSVLDRQNAKEYQQLLNPQDFLYQEINRILITHQNGIHQLSTGQKINATKITLRGGGKESLQKFFITISGEQDCKKYPFQAPDGKRITRYGEPKLEGREEDKKLITSNTTLRQGGIREKDLKDWERAGGGDVKAEFGGGLGARGELKTKDKKEYEEDYSNPTVVLEVKAKKPGLFKSMQPVAISVDVWLEDIPEKSEICEKTIEASAEGGEVDGDASVIAGNQPAAQEHVDKMARISAKSKDLKVKKNLLVSANTPLVITAKQMEDGVDIGRWRSEIDRIKADIRESEANEEKLMGKLDSAKTERLQEFYSKKLAEVSKEIKELKERKQKLEHQIDNISKREGKEEEKK